MGQNVILNMNDHGHIVSVWFMGDHLYLTLPVEVNCINHSSVYMVLSD